MVIDLTEDELDFLQDKPFWTWQHLKLDVQFAEIMKAPKKRIKQLKDEMNWYKDLYHKLGGEVK